MEKGGMANAALRVVALWQCQSGDKPSNSPKFCYVNPWHAVYNGQM